MKNDLTLFERFLLRAINNRHRFRFNYKTLMEWSTNKNLVIKNKREDEVIFEVDGIYVAIKPSEKDFKEAKEKSYKYEQ
jgi:hypothetical protein